MATPPNADERGSIVAVTNSSGAASGSGFGINTYDEYGTPGPSNLGRFQYTGQAWLPEAQLYHYKARAYSPSLGRFLQTDPIGFGGGMNLYGYAGNDPVNFTDPSGLVEEDEIVVIVARIDPCGGRGGCISDPQQIRELIDNKGRTTDDFGSSVHEGSGEDVIVVICGRACRNSRDHPTIMIGLGGGAGGTSEGGGSGQCSALVGAGNALVSLSNTLGDVSVIALAAAGGVAIVGFVVATSPVMAGAVLTGTLAMAATAGVFGTASGISLTAGGALQSFGGATGVGGQNFRNGAAATGLGLALGAFGGSTRTLSVFQSRVQNFINNGVTISGAATDAYTAAFPGPGLASC